MNKTSKIQVVENQWIPMSDGCRIAAKIWIPESAGKKPVPAILEYIPYRKRDIKAKRDSQLHGFFAGHGYACIRADLRGSGDSEGVLRDEYLKQELDDGMEILSWIASQPWCNGRVGMMGISWGGFNALQIAALQPPQLKAVISVCSSDDRYADDIHYMGGCLLTDQLSWASTMFAYNSCPPDPEVAGKKWKDMWMERLEGSGLWLRKWLKHQKKDSFWKHASICEDYSAIQVPVFAVSGWADGYSNPVFRLIEHLSSPVKGLVGPWGHKYPHMVELGPEIDFPGQCLKWWDKWLKGLETGIMDEPPLRVWMQDTVSPLVSQRPGRWVAEKAWPSTGIREQEFIVTSYGLDRKSDPETCGWRMDIQSPLSVGLFGGKWCSYSESTDLPWDQREEDGGALVFETAPLQKRTEILGRPVALLELSSNKPQAMVAVRLSDIGEDGRGTRVTFGLLNLTHRNSHESPEELEPDQKYLVRVPMNFIAQSFPAGHRIRLSVSTSYWPVAWPSPEPVKLSLYPGSSRLILPIREPSSLDQALTPFDPPPALEGIKTTLLVPAKREWTVIHNLADNTVKVKVINNDARIHLEHINLAVQKDVWETFSYSSNNYDTVRGEGVSKRGFQRNDMELSTMTRTVLTSTRTHFKITATLDAFEGDARIFSKSWDETIPRQMV
ncbi:CocE/NonD family hydrolase [Desulfonatronospira sp.]|uniref:CocE/NonD family hydrolase n=1 Tax=Desulfonatronospira sp. TaxID=1962951 RepID=UPI0025C53D06|nr:CocE/NonD family hydrolase [Desulfonatronospira sp.]